MTELLSLSDALCKLPKVLLREPEKLQRVPAVYFVWDSFRVCRYIGRAKDIHQRFTGSGKTAASSNGWSHKLFMKALKYPDVRSWVVSYQEIPEPELNKTERLYIQRYRPELNTQHIPKKRRRR